MLPGERQLEAVFDMLVLYLFTLLALFGSAAITGLVVFGIYSFVTEVLL